MTTIHHFDEWLQWVAASNSPYRPKADGNARMASNSNCDEPIFKLKMKKFCVKANGVEIGFFEPSGESGAPKNSQRVFGKFVRGGSYQDFAHLFSVNDERHGSDWDNSGRAAEERAKICLELYTERDVRFPTEEIVIFDHMAHGITPELHVKLSERRYVEEMLEGVRRGHVVLPSGSSTNMQQASMSRNGAAQHMDHQTIQKLVLAAIVENDGKWSWYQIDRALAIKHPGLGTHLMPILEALEREASIERLAANDQTAMPRYSITSKGRNLLTQTNTSQTPDVSIAALPAEESASMTFEQRCQVCSRVATRIEIRGATGAHRMVYEGIERGSGESGSAVNENRVRKIVEAFTRPYEAEKIRQADFDDDAGFCIKCGAFYCLAHWNTDGRGGGVCPKGHAKSLDPFCSDWDDE